MDFVTLPQSQANSSPSLLLVFMLRRAKTQLLVVASYRHERRCHSHLTLGKRRKNTPWGAICMNESPVYVYPKPIGGSIPTW